MENPLKSFNDFIENYDIVFLHHSFTQHPTYNKEEETIDDSMFDPFTGEEHEIKLSFEEHLVNTLIPRTRQAINILDYNLQSLSIGKEEDDYLTKVEREIDYLLKKLSGINDDKSIKVISTELNKIKNHILEKYRGNTPDTTTSNAAREKVVWKGNPAIFFMLFQELFTKQLMGTDSKKDSLAKFSKLLYEMVEVPPLNTKKSAYTQTSFEQYLKPSGGLQDYPNYMDLKNTVSTFVTKLMDEAKKL